MRVKYNYLIEFDSEECTLSMCENIMKDISDLFVVYHDDVERRCDYEDRTYDIIVHMYADDDAIEEIEEYLNTHGFMDKYSIYLRLVI